MRRCGGGIRTRNEGVARGRRYTQLAAAYFGVRAGTIEQTGHWLADLMTHPTSTARWSLAVHRVTATSVEVWVGTLFRQLLKPEHARVRLFRDDTEEATRDIARGDWKRPYRNMRRCFYFVAEFKGLKENTDYRLLFERYVEANEDIGICPHWQHLRNGRFRTLPGALPPKGQGAFTMGLASCYYSHRDAGQAAAAYKTLYDRGASAVRPDITVLCGDQVYLDIGFDSLSLIPNEIRERISEDYAEHWRELGSILSRGGTWMLPDDHEFWNDYPFVDSLIPTLAALKLGNVRKAWKQAALDAVKNIQRCPVVEFFSIGKGPTELTVCLADVRTYRTKKGFLPNNDFQRLLAWARGRKSPAILVLSQPLVVTRNKTERNLLSFGSQYAELLDALASSPCDIVVLSGDMHFGRIASVEIGHLGTRLIEVVSSPLSNLTGLSGIATRVAKDTPRRFPADSVARQLGWGRRKVNYFKDGKRRGRFFVQTEPPLQFWNYPRRRTREHFMTIGCASVPEKDAIELRVDAWLVRESANGRGLPKKSFGSPFRTLLRCRREM